MDLVIDGARSRGQGKTTPSIFPRSWSPVQRGEWSVVEAWRISVMASEVSGVLVAASIMPQMF
jgi:hypothetical protein